MRSATRLEPPTFISTGRYTLAVYLNLAYPPDDEVGVVDHVCRIAPGLVFSRHLHEIRASDSLAVLNPSLIRIQADTVALRPLLGPLC